MSVIAKIQSLAAAKRKYLFEWELLNQVIVTFFLLVSLEAIYLFYRNGHIFTAEFLLDIYLTLSVVLIAGAVWHLKSYGTDLESAHLGMMTGMTLGMQAGMMGGIMGAMTGAMLLDDLFWFMPPFMTLNFIIMMGLGYMVFKEVTEKKGILHKSPPRFPHSFLFNLVALTVLTLAVNLMPEGNIVGHSGMKH